MKRLQKWLIVGGLLPSVLAAAPLSKTELQWAICEPSMESFFEKLGTPRKSEESTLLSYFDTESLDLFFAGVFLHSTNEYSKAKIEFQNTAQIDFDWMETNGARCEWDRYGAKKVVRCALKHKPHKDEARWSGKQQDFIRHFKNVSLPQKLHQWGPYRMESWSLNDIALAGDQTLIVESLNTNGATPHPIIELSTRVPSDEADNTFLNIQTYLKRHQVETCLVQGGKFERLINLLMPKAPQPQE